MTDDRDIVRGYSQDKQIYRHDSISIKRNSLTQYRRTSENYYSNRNCPEIISLFALKNRHLDDREKQIYHSVSNDTHYFSRINYPIQSSAATPIPNLTLEAPNQQDKQLKFPKVTPRIISTTTAKKFPTLTARVTSTVDRKNSIPSIKTSVKSISSSLNKPSQTKMPMVATEEKKKVQLSKHLHPTE